MTNVTLPLFVLLPGDGFFAVGIFFATTFAAALPATGFGFVTGFAAGFFAGTDFFTGTAFFANGGFAAMDFFAGAGFAFAAGFSALTVLATGFFAGCGFATGLPAFAAGFAATLTAALVAGFSVLLRAADVDCKVAARALPTLAADLALATLLIADLLVTFAISITPLSPGGGVL